MENTDANRVATLWARPLSADRRFSVRRCCASGSLIVSEARMEFCNVFFLFFHCADPRVGQDERHRCSACVSTQLSWRALILDITGSTLYLNYLLLRAFNYDEYLNYAIGWFKCNFVAFYFSRKFCDKLLLRKCIVLLVLRCSIDIGIFLFLC